MYAEFAAANIESPNLLGFYRQKALQGYAALLENYPDKRQVILNDMIPVLYQQRDYTQCLEYCEEILQHHKFMPTGILYKARCLYDTRQMTLLKLFGASVSNSEAFQKAKEEQQNLIALENCFRLIG